MNSATLEMFDAVRDALNGRVTPEDQRRELAMRVSETASLYRKRVDRAVRYARQGLRLEAASEAEAEPALFELAQLLDTEDLHNWRSLCARQQWPTPETPDPAALAEIEEAIGQLRPLRKHLARMRTAVLGDAGPWERLAILRELIARDPHNPAWQDDQQSLEPVAASWLAERCERAVQANKLEEAAGYLEHLSDGKWRAVSTGKPLSHLRPKYNRAVVAECHKAGPDAVQRVENEWAAQSVEGVASALANWHALEARAVEHDGSMPEELGQRVNTAEAWLGEKQTDADARRDSATKLRVLVSLVERGNASLPELRKALAAADNSADGCPEDIRRQAVNEISRLETRGAQRRTLAVVGAVLAVALVVAGAWYGVQWTTESNRIQVLAKAIQTAVAAGDLDGAAQRMAEADQDLEASVDPLIVEARKEYMKARNARAAGDRDFDALMAAAGDPESAQALRSKVEEAGKLSRTEDQQKAVSEWLKLNKRADDARASERTQELLAELRTVANIIADNTAVDSAARNSALGDCETRIAAVEKAARGNPAVTSEADRVRTLLVAQRALVESNRQAQHRTAGLKGLASAGADAAAYRAALERFATEHAGTPEAALIADAVTAAPLWESVAEWNALGKGVTPSMLGTMPQAERDNLVAQLRTFVTAHPGTPNAAAANTLIGLLSSTDGWRNWLSDKLKDLPEFTYYTIELKDGTRYYTLQDPERIAIQKDTNGRTYRIVTVLQTSGVEPQTSFQRVEDATLKSQGPSAQMKLADVVRPYLEKDEEGTLCPNGVQCAFTTLAKIREADQVDGAFAALLVRGFLESLVADLPSSTQAPLQSLARAIAREKPDTVQWVTGAGGAREKSRALQALVHDGLKVDQWRKAYGDALTAAAAPLSVGYRPAGIMLQGGGESEGVNPAPQRTLMAPDNQPFAKGSELFALRPGVGNDASSMVLVGKVDANGSAAPTAEAASFPVGTMVFTRVGGGA